MKNIGYIAGIIAILLFSCSLSTTNTDIPIAKVGESYLYLSDLDKLINSDTSPADSASFVINYIGTWARQQLKLEKAHFNLKESEIDINKQVENYKNSLIIYAYERQLIQQTLDTVITDTEIEEYYLAHKSNFELKNNILKIRYAKTSNELAIDTIKKYIRSNNEEDLLHLDEYAKKNRITFYFNDSEWLLFDDVLKEVPITTYNQQNYLRNHRYIELKGQSLYYFVNILDFKIKESTSPLSYELGRIKNIILNKRKKNLLEKMEEQIYTEALENGKFEIYGKL